MRACYGDAAPNQEAWTWLHQGTEGAEPACMLAWQGARLAGMQPFTVWPYVFDGNKFWGSVLTGVMVHPDFRRQGLFRELLVATERASWEAGADFVFSLPNARSWPGFLRAAYQDLGQRRLFVKALRVPSRLVPARIVQWMHKPSEFNAQQAHAQKKPSHLSDVPVEALDALTTQSLAYKKVLHLDKSSSWLRWRYGGSPLRDYGHTLLRGEDGALTGLAVTTRERRAGLRIHYIMDWFAQGPSEEKKLLRQALQGCADAGAELCASVVSSPAQMRALVRAGFAPVPFSVSPKKFYTVAKWRRALPKGMRDLQSVRRWSLSLGDWDNL